MLKSLILVFFGGGTGSLFRYGLSNLLNQHFPYGTMISNILGSLLIGIFLGLFEKQILSETQLLMLAVGFCGGFTTFSTFAAENMKMLQNGDYLNFSLYASGSFVLGIMMVFIGFKLAGKF